MPSRRRILQLAPLLLGAALAPRFSFAQSSRHYSPSGTPLRRVNVSADRVIRTLVGLRPYRSSGFVVRAEKLGDKTVVHNYGHGGGGVTLSWGTAQLAAELVPESQDKRCAVIGCGAVGLASARLLQERGYQVRIYARDLPPNTTSNIAGAQWSPTSVFAPNNVSFEFLRQFESAMRFSYRYYQTLLGERYGVRWITNYEFGDIPPAQDNVVDAYPDMFPGLAKLTAEQHPFRARVARRYDTMLIDPTFYLPALLEDFTSHGGEVVQRELKNQADIHSLEEATIINCMGLGSGDIFVDPDLFPIKGQLLALLPQEEVDYIAYSGGRSLFMLPRKNEILLGSTFQRGQSTLTPDEGQSKRTLGDQKLLFDAMEDPWS